MKTEKMSFKNIKDVLSRDEMRSIIAGSNSSSCGKCSNPNGGTTSCYAGSSGSGCTCMCLWRSTGCGSCG